MFSVEPLGQSGQGEKAMSVSDLAFSLRRCGDSVSLGGLAGLLAIADVRVESLRVERGCSTITEGAEGGVRWVALLSVSVTLASGYVDRAYREGYGPTIALALAAGCDALAADPARVTVRFQTAADRAQGSDFPEES